MPNYRTPAGGTTLSGPVNMLMADGSYMPLFDAQGLLQAPQMPMLAYSKPPGATAGTPTNTQVQALCQLLAPLVAEQVVKQSAMLSRITVLPQQSPATGYSSLAATYTYTFGATSVTNTVNTRRIYGEKVPVDLVLANQTLIADMAARLGGSLAQGVDVDTLALWSSFTANAAQGTSATPFTSANVAAAVNLVKNTGEPIFVACLQSQHGPANFGATGIGLLNDTLAPITAATLANGASPSAPLQGVWLLPTPSVGQTGGGPTTHNIVFTPSAIAFTCEVETNINNTNTTAIANAQSTGSFGNITVSVWALNTASGVQTIYCSIAYGTVVAINANGCQLTS